MFSELANFSLIDERRQSAQLVDMAIDLAAGDYPPVRRLVFRTAAKQPSELPWDAVKSIDWRQRRIFLTDLADGRDASREGLSRAVLLKRDLMDALVVDVARRQATRANDLWLQEESGQLWLTGADVSSWAVLRRMGKGLLGRGDDRRLLDWKDLEFLRGDPRAARDGSDYHRRITRLQPAEIARLLDALPYLHAAELLTIVPDPLAADTLEAMSPERQMQVLDELDDDQAARLLDLMAPDAAAQLLGRIRQDRFELLLGRVPDAQRDRIVELLRFPPDTAGGIMTNQILVLPAALTIGQARQVLREQLAAPDFVYYIYVDDTLEDRRLQGVLTLRDFVLAADEQPITSVMNRTVSTVDALESAAAAARQVADQQLVALPVTAHDGRLLGAITIDAAVRRIAPSGWGHQAPRVFS
jgi:magnesium transporter